MQFISNLVHEFCSRGEQKGFLTGLTAAQNAPESGKEMMIGAAGGNRTDSVS
jgi:hypothetical protein